MIDYTIQPGETVAQGELRIRAAALPEGVTLRPFADPKHGGAWVMSHSEKGHHHLLSADGVDVLEHPEPPAGCRILYAIVSNPAGARLHQSAAEAHGAYHLPPGVYRIGRDRERDPMMDQARAVRD